MLAGNVRRDFRRALALVPGLDPSIWTPRELRHSFMGSSDLSMGDGWAASGVLIID
jgi:hypothetical protein